MKLNTRSARAASTSSTANPKMLIAWLREQASRLLSLEAEGNRLKMAIVQNAKLKGAILIDVRKRLAGNSQSFKQWVEETSDIGYSTALLWIDIAENYEELTKRFADSNLLELTIRQIRDAIRDLRQEHGIGKPGSGRKKPTETSTPDSGELDYSGKATTPPEPNKLQFEFLHPGHFQLTIATSTFPLEREEVNSLHQQIQEG